MVTCHAQRPRPRSALRRAKTTPPATRTEVELELELGFGRRPAKAGPKANRFWRVRSSNSNLGFERITGTAGELSFALASGIVDHGRVTGGNGAYSELRCW